MRPAFFFIVSLWGIHCQSWGLFWNGDSLAESCTKVLPGGGTTCPLALSGAVTTLAGSGTASAIDGNSTTATFNNPNGVVVLDAYLYVADKLNRRIRRVTLATGDVITLAGSGATGGADGIGIAATFNLPAGITSDGTHLYVSDQATFTIRKIVIATAAVTTIAGANGVAGSTDSPTGTSARFQGPSGITSDGVNLYIADQADHKIRKMNIASTTVTTLAGAGGAGAGDGAGATAQFNNPSALTLSGTKLYLCDSGNHLIRTIDAATGNVATMAGLASTSGATDGTGSSARFFGPSGITNDGTNLYVSDQNNNKIRKVLIATASVTTLAGTGTAGSADGTISVATFNAPGGLATDGGSLFVGDQVSNKIRKIN